MKSAINHSVMGVVFSVSTLFLSAMPAYATVIGTTPATWLAATSNNDFAENGPRANVDLSHPVTLAAGDYNVTLFDFIAKQEGNVTPFLGVISSGATGNGSATDKFDFIAVGANQIAPNTVTSDTLFSVAFGGSNTFTLSVSTTVYAGFANISNPGGGISTLNPLPVDTSGTPRGFIDHNGGGYTLATLVVGGQATFTNFNLNREYPFDIQVQLVPEPGSLNLISLGLIGLFAVTRGRRPTL